MSDNDNPYTPDQQRVAQYIVEQSHGTLGGGDDPIGFLMTQNEWWRRRSHRLEDVLQKIATIPPAQLDDCPRIAREALLERP